MDHIAHFKEMSVRTIVSMAFMAILSVFILGMGIVLFFSLYASVYVIWALSAVVLVCGVIVWLWTDRMLAARLHDHRSLPARPEFYDFQDLNQPMHWDEMGGKELKELTYVVFDTETTGLSPSTGDEIISIGAVRISNGEIDEAGAFYRLVNPGMAIPKQSIQYHGITDDMVAKEDHIESVLPSFKEYVGDAILVAHNAAFDMKFLKLKEEKTGIIFPNLVLDTLLISVFLDHESHNHSLDGIAKQMGITIEGRHTALGDAVATAKLLNKMIFRLEARGITSLRRVVEASAKIEHVRKLKEKF
ncbi:MAG: exonuclease domain-containing protein [Rhodospirillaceae bacterium]|nr:exonuclease domain-containing protein [Rhodospirillaceae bacterium]